MPQHLLTDLAVKAAKPKPNGKAYRLADGEGLYLYVPASGVKSWQFRYRHDGKPQTATLGKLSNVTLPEARKKAHDARRGVADGDQLTVLKRVKKARKAAASATTFGVLKVLWIRRQMKRENWSADYRSEVEASLRNHLSDLDALPIEEITAQIVTPLLESSESRAPDMARKVERRLQSIMHFAVRRGVIRGNPIPPPERSKRSKTSVRNRPAVLTRSGIGAILRAGATAEVSRGVRRAHLLTVFTAQRIGEIVGARWCEFDMEAGTWAIPRERMKRKEEARGPHLVPIPPVLLKTILEWRKEDGDDAIFASPAPRGGGPVTREAVEKFYRRSLKLSGKHSPHSWRSVFSTWARDAQKDRDAIELQLDHVIGNKVEAAYARANMFEARRKLMGWYERQIIEARDGGDVVPLRRTR